MALPNDTHTLTAGIVGNFIKAINNVASKAKDSAKEFQKLGDKMRKAGGHPVFNTVEETIAYQKGFDRGVQKATREANALHRTEISKVHSKMKIVFADEVTMLVDEIDRLKETLAGPAPRQVRVRRKIK